MSCGVGCRRGSDSALLWLWRRPVATAPIRPLAWEPPYAEGAAQEMAKRQKKKKKVLLETVRCSQIQNIISTISLWKQYYFLC